VSNPNNHDVLRELLLNDRKAKVWIEDADGIRIEDVVDYDMLYMVDGLLTWGFLEWDDEDFSLWDSDSEEELPPVPGKFCKAYDHVFESKTLCNSKYRECNLCKYSPELDKNKDEFKVVHTEFIQWERDMLEFRDLLE